MSQTPGSLPSPSAVFCPILEPRKKRTEAREGIIRVAGGGYGLVTGQARSAEGCAAPFIGWLRRGQGRWPLIGWTGDTELIAGPVVLAAPLPWVNGSLATCIPPICISPCLPRGPIRALMAS